MQNLQPLGRSTQKPLFPELVHLIGMSYHVRVLSHLLSKCFQRHARSKQLSSDGVIVEVHDPFFRGIAWPHLRCIGHQRSEIRPEVLCQKKTPSDMPVSVAQPNVTRFVSAADWIFS